MSAQPDLKPTLEEVCRVVADYYGRTPKGLRSKSRGRDVLLPRQLAMYLSRELMRRSYAEIGRYFQRNHSTVIHSIRKIRQALPGDSMLESHIEALCSRLQASELKVFLRFFETRGVECRRHDTCDRAGVCRDTVVVGRAFFLFDRNGRFVGLLDDETGQVTARVERETGIGWA